MLTTMQNRMKEYKGEQDFKPILQRLSMALADVEAGNNSESLLNEIRQITAQKMKFSIKDFFSKFFSIFARNCGFGHIY